MSHWYRSPSSFSLAKLLRHRSFILDPTVSGDLMSCFPDGVFACQPADLVLELSRPKLVRMCHTRHSVLITADREFVPLLSVETKQPWGLLLLPRQPESHGDVLQRLFAGRIVFRPSVERSAMIEMIGQNRFLLDFSLDDPSLNVFCSCKWV
jgi:hypothetical protein